jgi:PIN like domain
LKFEFFTDRDLGKRFPEILASAGLSVKRHDDLFPPDCSDERWLAHIGKSRWIAITHNARIRYMPNELDAVVRHAVALLVVVGKAPLKDVAENFVATMPRISEFLEKHEPPLIAKVYRPVPAEIAKDSGAPGSITLWYPK